METNRIVISTKTNPYWNLAVENYLLSQPDNEGVILYLWKNHRTVVIGQNQNPFAECNVDLLLEDGGFLLRRTTGGGAVYHDDGNINFSFIAPPSLYDQQRHFAVIQRALSHYGLVAELSGRNDMLCQGRKFSGNAFSKGRYQNLHHGTILIKGNMDDLQRYLKPNKSKLQKHGVASVQSRVVNLSDLADITSVNIVPNLVDAFDEEYGLKALPLDYESLLSNPEVVALHDKYSSEDWLFTRWRSFSAQKQAQFDWGRVEVSLAVENQTIKGVFVTTDALDTTIPAQLEQILIGASSLRKPLGVFSSEIKDILNLLF